MKKIMILLLPFFIGCSFQVKDTVNEEERLSRRFMFEDETYGEFNFNKGFSPYEYELNVKDDEINNAERSPRELTLFGKEENFKKNQNDQYNDEFKILEKTSKEIDYKY